MQEFGWTLTNGGGHSTDVVLEQGWVPLLLDGLHMT